MTTKNSLVKTMFMNILTAGTLFAFTACSKDEPLMDDKTIAAPVSNEASVAARGGIPEAYGLKYDEFITPNDVEILNDDTTQIAVSKAFADKKGITDFVNHPMGIKQRFEDMPYLRRAVKQELVGDKYILTVVRAGVAEVLAGQNVELNTAIYVNPNAGTTRAGSAAKYTDEHNVVHPTAVRILSLPGEETATTRSGALVSYPTLTAEQILNGETFVPQTRSLSDIINALIKFVETGNVKCDSHGRIMNLKGTLNPPKSSIQLGKSKDDTLTIECRVPYDISLDYTLKLDAQFGMKVNTDELYKYIFNPLDVFTVDTREFKSRLDGEINVTPEVSIGVGAKAEIPKDKRNLKLVSLGNYFFEFQIGPVPVPVVLQPAIYLQLNGSVEGRVYTGVQLEYKSKFFAELKYDKYNKWQALADYSTTKCEFSFLPPRATVKVKAGAGVMLGVDVMVGGVAGPSFSVGPMVTSNMNLKLAPYDEVPFAFDANIKFGLHGKAGAKLKLFTLELADWQQDIVFGEEKTLWSIKCDSNDFPVLSSDDKLGETVKKMKEEAAAKKRENDANWNAFVTMMESDSDVQDVLRLMKHCRYKGKLLERFLRGVKAGYQTSLVKTRRYAEDTFTTITSDHYGEMKAHLLQLLDELDRSFYL